MRYVVLGCGAIGGTVAAGLVRDGHDVLVCDADPAVVAAINDRGLRIEGPVENFTVRVPAVRPERPAGASWTGRSWSRSSRSTPRPPRPRWPGGCAATGSSSRCRTA